MRSDQEGNITRSPFSDIWPLETRNTLTLEEIDGKTTLTLRGYPVNASEVEIKAFEAGHESMKQGFSGTFGQLEEYLAKVSLKKKKNQSKKDWFFFIIKNIQIYITLHFLPKRHHACFCTSKLLCSKPFSCDK